ncbi:MAG: hypothetical protein R3F31_23420 [Verrucomicrobiales bacterium]
MSLLDGDRFEGRFRDGVHAQDVSDLMRRMVKEQLLKFDATPLFPERRALHSALQTLEAEATSLQRSHQLRSPGVQPRWKRFRTNKRSGTVGFALTILQRRLGLRRRRPFIGRFVAVGSA